VRIIKRLSTICNKNEIATYINQFDIRGKTSMHYTAINKNKNLLAFLQCFGGRINDKDIFDISSVGYLQAEFVPLTGKESIFKIEDEDNMTINESVPITNVII